MRIYINEQQEKVLMTMMIKESEGEQNLLIFNFLNNNFQRLDYAQRVNGKPQKTNAAVWLDYNKQPMTDKLVSEKELFYIVQNEFKKICGSNKALRDKRLQAIVNAWLNNKYNKITGNILI